MKVDGKSPELQELQTKRTQGTKPRESLINSREQASDPSYQVSLSDRRNDYDKALQIARNTPVERSDRIHDLKQRIEAGAYTTDAGQIADGMLKEAIKEELSVGIGQ